MKSIKERTKKYELGEKKVIIAVSGGVDSVVLLDLMTELLPKKNIFVAHFNHGVRLESDADENFVKLLSKKYNHSFYSKKIKPQKQDEAYLRSERYRWLESLREALKADYILTAHHLSDQAETILLNLIRGSGPLELWGMKEQSGHILRLMLDVSKKDIIDYAKKKKLKYFEDKTNKDIRYLRNRVRSRILPEIKKINPSFEKTLYSNVELANELKRYIENEVKKLERKVRVGNKLKLEGLKNSEPYMTRELIKKMLFELTDKRHDIYSRNINEVYELINKEGTKKTELMGFTVIKDYDFLVFGAKTFLAPNPLTIQAGEEIDFSERRFKVWIGDAKPQINNILLPLKFSDNLEIRVWQAGDKIATNYGTKKLQDVFVDAKISLSERKKWPVVVSGKEILWVPGLVASRYSQHKNKNLIIEVK